LYSFKGEAKPRRQVNYASTVPDPSTLPPLWSAWLRNLRPYPPTEAEITQYKARQAALAQRVRALEREDALMKEQEMELKLQRTFDRNNYLPTKMLIFYYKTSIRF